jgi:hypothetical protein
MKSRRRRRYHGITTTSGANGRTDFPQFGMKTATINFAVLEPTRSSIRRRDSSKMLGQSFFWVRSYLYVNSDSVHICTETVSIFQEILRAKSVSGALMQCGSGSHVLGSDLARETH